MAAEEAATTSVPSFRRSFGTPRAAVKTTPQPPATPVPAPPALPAEPVPEPVPQLAPAPTSTPESALVVGPGQEPTDTDTGTESPTPIPILPFTELNLTGARTQVHPPSVIQLVFSLRTDDNRAVSVSPEDIRAGTRIFERPGETIVEDADIEELIEELAEGVPAQAPEDEEQALPEGWEEIDYDETSFFVHPAENFEVVFILDFTDSMARARLSDGRSGIEAVSDALRSTIAFLPVANRIAAVEFHDRSFEPTILSGLTTNWVDVLEAVDDFASSDFDPGSSRLWDSIATATSIFPIQQEDSDATQAIIFISDGRDTSSRNTRSQVGIIASENGVQLYSLGVGDVFEERELAEMLNATGGAYYSVKDLDRLEEQLQLLVTDLLRGQYKVSYITLRQEGFYRVRVDVTLGGLTGSFATESLDVASFYSPDTQGQLDFDPPSVDRILGNATVLVRVDHVPRNITGFRFRLETDESVAVKVVPRAEGGLLRGGEVSGPDEQGYFEVSSDQPLEFGNSGPLFQIVLSSIPELLLPIPVDIPIFFDNSIYSSGKSFTYAPIIFLGRNAVP